MTELTPAQKRDQLIGRLSMTIATQAEDLGKLREQITWLRLALGERNEAIAVIQKGVTNTFRDRGGLHLVGPS